MHKYSIRKICKFLKISKSCLYYKSKNQKQQTQNIIKEQAIISAFNNSKGIYGARKIKAELIKKNIIVSRRKIRIIMQLHELISKYTIAKYKRPLDETNEDKIANHLNQNFDNKDLGEVLVSDLTYVEVGLKLTAIDISGNQKNANLVNEALLSTSRSLKETKIFHTDRGSEFKNHKISKTLKFFGIISSLSKKGCPYDNAVAEATYKIFKTELINGQKFNSLFELKIKVFDYIKWYNNWRIHGSLGYLTPVEYRNNMSIKKLS